MDRYSPLEITAPIPGCTGDEGRSESATDLTEGRHGIRPSPPVRRPVAVDSNAVDARDHNPSLLNNPFQNRET